MPREKILVQIKKYSGIQSLINQTEGILNAMEMQFHSLPLDIWQYINTSFLSSVDLLALGFVSVSAAKAFLSKRFWASKVQDCSAKAKQLIGMSGLSRDVSGAGLV